MPVMRLNSVDLPTLGRPTSTTVGLSAERFRAMSKRLVSTDIDSVSVSILYYLQILRSA